MVWLGQPTLVSVGPTGWLALVGLVGQAGDLAQGSAHNVAIALSTNGGDTWTDPHLVAPPDGTLGGSDNGSGVIVSDIAAAAATWTNPLTGTHDIFVVWQPHSSTQSWVRTVAWDSSAAWVAPAAATSLPHELIEPTLVTGTHNVIGNFAFAIGGKDPKIRTEPASTCSALGLGSSIVPQVYVTFWSAGANLGASWFAGPQLGAQMARCVGGDHTTTNTPYPNSLRAALAFDPIDNYVAYAIGRLRPSDTARSTEIATFGSSWCAGCGGGQGNGNFGTPTVVSETQRDGEIPTGNPDDQFDPSISVDNFGLLAVDWVDPVTTQNYPRSVHGQVQPFFTNPTPSNFVPYAVSFPFGESLPDFGEHFGNAPLGNGVFALGFSDGYTPGTAPNGLGGMWTTVATP